MDDSKKRTITEETLKRTVEKMNPVLIKSLQQVQKKYCHMLKEEPIQLFRVT